MPKERQLLQFSPLGYLFQPLSLCPLNGRDLNNILPSDFTLLTVPKVLKRHKDPWKDILVRGQDLGKILDNLSPIKL
jgi:DNA primase